MFTSINALRKGMYLKTLSFINARICALKKLHLNFVENQATKK